jgi:deazaflavin-dependent oxidoreductase (nitroreductase family)
MGSPRSVSDPGVDPGPAGHAPAPHPRLGRRMARFNHLVLNKVMVHVADVLPGLGVVSHMGRVTRNVYRTPVNVFRTKCGFRMALTYGSDAEWVKNALAMGAVRLVTRSKTYELTDPRLVTDPHHQCVPAYARAMLRLLRVSEFIEFRSAV